MVIKAIDAKGEVEEDKEDVSLLTEQQDQHADHADHAEQQAESAWEQAVAEVKAGSEAGDEKKGASEEDADITTIVVVGNGMVGSHGPVLLALGTL